MRAPEEVVQGAQQRCNLWHAPHWGSYLEPRTKRRRAQGKVDGHFISRQGLEAVCRLRLQECHRRSVGEVGSRMQPRTMRKVARI